MSDPIDPIERQIQDAIERGDFEHLPGAGKPLDTSDHGPGWWTRRFLTRIRAADRAAEVARQIDQELGRLWVLSDEATVRNRLAQLNTRLSEANNGLAEEERVDLLDPNQVVATWWRMARARNT